MKKVWIIVRKEWREVFKHRIVLFSVAFLPLIISTIPVLALYASQNTTALSELEELGNMLVFADQLCADLSESACGQFLLLQQFMPLFLMVPVIIPVTIASYSIVGEKTRRTLEPLLATPISTTQLLAGKAFAAVIPAVAATLVGFGIFAAGTALCAGDVARACSLYGSNHRGCPAQPAAHAVHRARADRGGCCLTLLRHPTVSTRNHSHSLEVSGHETIHIDVYLYVFG